MTTGGLCQMCVTNPTDPSGGAFCATCLHEIVTRKAAALGIALDPPKPKAVRLRKRLTDEGIEAP